jgi:hypothetical protein
MTPHDVSPESVHIAGGAGAAVADGSGVKISVVAAGKKELYVLVRIMRSVSVKVVV